MKLYNPTGVSQFLTFYLNELRTKKTVALFSSYQKAKEDLLMELVSKGTVGEATIDDMINLTTKLESIMDIEGYFDSIGRD